MEINLSKCKCKSALESLDIQVKDIELHFDLRKSVLLNKKHQLLEVHLNLKMVYTEAQRIVF